MKILSKEDSKEIDLKLQEVYGVDEIVLMENAGNDVYLVIKEIRKSSFENVSFIIFCGVGNNGGDGLVVARKLLSVGRNVVVFLVGDKEKFTPSARKNFEILSKLTGEVYFVPSPSLETFEEIYSFVEGFFSKDTLVVDALVGTGLTSSLREPVSTVVDVINRLKGKGAEVVSVDVPSGFVVSFDKSDVMSFDRIVEADYTVTFFSIKAGMFFPEMKKYLGKVVVSTLGFKEDLISSIVPKSPDYLSPESISFPKRDVSSNKSSNGRVVIIGGSDKYFGAVMLAARGASRTGVGYIIAFVLEKFNSVIKAFAPDVVSIPVPSGERGCFSEKDAEFILDSGVIRDDDVVVVGNGITVNEGTEKFLKELLTSLSNIFVVDADGVNILAKDITFFRSLANKSKIVLTPHIGEFARLVRTGLEEVRGRAFSFAKEFCNEIGTNLVLKDNVTYVVFHDGESWISDLNTPVLARAGTGDVLAGLIGGNISFSKDIKKGTLLGIGMLGFFSREWKEDGFYPTPLEVISTKLFR